jgi:presequence protease
MHTGDTYRGFLVTRCLPIEELHCQLIELTHSSSGAQVMQIANDDLENVFCLSFRTFPNSSRGTPHILEHLVLCGSQKFPLKDLFFAMTRRSLNTFMNAFTGNDFTCYPAATQVEKDFYHLLEVYIDAVFHPVLKKESFLQEGHRLEFAIPDSHDSPLEHKGVVFNEMKGSMTSSDTRLWHELLAGLFPDLPYFYNPGGDPKEIPKITYEELIDFHEAYYHPSRCLFFFYGNIKLEKHLDFLEEKILKNVRALPKLPLIAHQKRFSSPRYKEHFYPINEEEELENKWIVSLGWILAPLTEQEDLLSFALIDSMMMNTDASLLRLPLLESGLCLQADSYMDTDMSEVPYAIVCKGCHKNKVDDLEQLILTTLQTIATNGFPPHLIEAAMHQLEIARTEIGGDHLPFGLTLFMRSCLAKQHGCKPEDALKIHSLFEEVRERLKSPSYLSDLIKKYLLDSSHRLRLVSIPDPKLTEREEREEKKALEDLKKQLSLEEKEKIIQQSFLLKEIENQEQPLHLLPKMDLDDIPTSAKDFHLTSLTKDSLTSFHHTCFTNHFLYADCIFDLSPLKQEELFVAHLFLSLLEELGSGPRTYKENLEYIQAHTGGIAASTSLCTQVMDSHQMRPFIALRGKTLNRNAPFLFSLFQDMILAPRLDEKNRIRELLLQWSHSLQTRLQNNVMRYATHLASSSLSQEGFIAQQWNGLTFYQKMQKLSHRIDKELDSLIEALQIIKDKLFLLKNFHLVTSCQQETYDWLKKEQFFGLPFLSPGVSPHLTWDQPFPIPLGLSQARVIASPVAYIVKSLKTVTYIHPHAPALYLISQLLEHCVLHPQIRVRGGAYGAGANYNSLTGTFYFYSYRDPNIRSTLNAFKNSLTFLFKESDLEEAKLSLIQHFDAPISVANRAFTAYSWKREQKTLDLRQRFRDQLLALSLRDIQQVLEKELIAKEANSIQVAFAGKQLLEREQWEFPIFSLQE